MFVPSARFSVPERRMDLCENDSLRFVRVIRLRQKRHATKMHLHQRVHEERFANKVIIRSQSEGEEDRL